MKNSEQKAIDVNTSADFVLYRLCKYFFREYAAAKDLTTDDMKTVSLKRFVEWVENQLSSMPQEEMDRLFESLNVPEGAGEEFWKIMTDPYAAIQCLFSIWPMIRLESQPPLKNPIKFIHLTATVGYEDETVAQFPVATYASEEKPFSDGFVISVWTKQLLAIAQYISAVGLDKIHDEHGTDLASLPTKLEDLQ